MTHIDPIALELGPLVIRWYSLAYLFGILGGWWLAVRLSRKADSPFTPELISDFVVWATLGVILGARLGYVLFYNPAYYLHNPAEILAVWHGGMSFHGGLIGVITALLGFAYKNKLNLLAAGDIVACVSPIGLMLGRCANFVNGELYGRIAIDLPWAVAFPAGGGFPRHPSQLYEAFFEGFLPLIVLNLLWFLSPWVRAHKGFSAGLFLVWYAISRMGIEFFREPDLQIGYLLNYFTMGQFLCLPVLGLGIWLIAHSVAGGKDVKNV
ncbi:MAG: prolipoprotein diacylglyceryl transferase [Alphaproteobacteria bacterium]|nr:prolipoprotein diacylglyceryl transferase [Alphaproteobacteria bacterium]